MKNLIVYSLVALLLLACKNNTEQQNVSADELLEDLSYASFGETISQEDALSKDEMAAVFSDLKPGDTLDVKFTSTVNEVCQSKGCWMKLDLGEQETMVKFKDYGFFMPKNSAGHEVILEGKAFVNEMSVEEQRHYAEDADASQAEIEQITTPKKTYSFEAVGVLLKE